MFIRIGGLGYPRPRITLQHMVNGRNLDPVPPTEVRDRHNSLKRPNLANILFRQDYMRSPLTAVGCAMVDLVCLIFSVGGPSQMAGINTTELPFSARVRCLMLWGRWAAMGDLAHYPRGNALSALVPDSAIASRFINLERPLKALATGVVSVFRNPPERPVHFSAPASRIAMAPPSGIVLSAEAARSMLSIATWYRTYTGMRSHLDLSKGWAWLEPAVALQRWAGSLFVLASGPVNNGEIRCS